MHGLTEATTGWVLPGRDWLAAAEGLVPVVVTWEACVSVIQTVS